MSEIDPVRILEGALFASQQPLSLARMKRLWNGSHPPTEGMLREALSRLADSYANRAVRLVEVAGGFRFQVINELAPYLAALHDERPGRYSRATLETLAMIAYRQPVTRGDIEAIRGVAVNTQTIRTLEERGWIRVVGQRDVPGRPQLYATTTQFLDDFGLQSLDQLPNPDGLVSAPMQDLLDQDDSHE